MHGSSTILATLARRSSFFLLLFFFFEMEKMETYPIRSLTLLIFAQNSNSHQPYPACPSMAASVGKVFSRLHYTSHPPVQSTLDGLSVKSAFSKWLPPYQLIQLERDIYPKRASFPRMPSVTILSIPAPSRFALKISALKKLLLRPQTNSLIMSRNACIPA